VWETLEHARRATFCSTCRAGLHARGSVDDVAEHQGLTLVHFSFQPKPFESHPPVSPCLIDWRKIMPSTYPTKRAYVERKSG